MSNFNLDDLKSQVLSFVQTNVQAAKDDIANYIDSNKDMYISWSQGLIDGSITKDLVSSLLENEKNVIQAILLKHILFTKIAAEDKAKALALNLTTKLITIIITALL
jgi:hypothetical protein